MPLLRQHPPFRKPRKNDLHRYYNADCADGVIRVPFSTDRPNRRVLTRLDEHIAEVLHEIRIKKGLSPEEVADKAQIKTKRIMRIEQAFALPFITELEAMANALDVKFWQVMKEAEERRAREKGGGA